MLSLVGTVVRIVAKDRCLFSARVGLLVCGPVLLPAPLIWPELLEELALSYADSCWLAICELLKLGFTVPEKFPACDCLSP